MGCLASTMPADSAPSLYPLTCLDQLRAVADAGEAILYPTLLVRESADFLGMSRRLSVCARTVPVLARVLPFPAPEATP